MVNTISVTLPNGNVLDVEYVDALIEQIKQRYGLLEDVNVPPELIKAFIEDELRTALWKHDMSA